MPFASFVHVLEQLLPRQVAHTLDDAGERHAVSSEDVNEYLRTLTGEDYTAKDFRTWAGTLEAAMALLELAPYETPVQAKKNVDEAIKAVAGKLGNTPRICRNCYVHPLLIEGYLDEHQWGLWQEDLSGKTIDGTPAGMEDAILTLFEQRLTAGKT